MIPDIKARREAMPAKPTALCPVVTYRGKPCGRPVRSTEPPLCAQHLTQARRREALSGR